MKMKKKFKIVALLLTFAMVFTACGNTQTADTTTEVVDEQEQTQVEETVEETTEDTGVDKSVYMDPSQDVETRVEALLAQMTLEEKVGQMLQPEQNGLTPEQVAQYGIGSVLSGGGSAPATGNKAEDWQGRINELKQGALDSRLGIPLLYGVDAVHGNNNVYGATVFPHNIGLGAANDEALMEEIGRVTAEEVRAIGVQWTFAPTLGNAQNERWGRTYECYSEDAADVVPLGAAYIRGTQGTLGSDAFLDESHILACAKHFIGEGYTTDGVNQGNVEMTPEEFEALLESGILDPYTKAIDEGVRTVMVSYNSIDGVKCHENGHLINDILKGQLGFTGLVVSDYNGVQQTSGLTYKAQVKLSVNAGIDLFMEPYTWMDCSKALVELVESGEVTQERIDDAVRRILRVKFEAGLFEEEIGSAKEQELLAAFGSDEHREVARRAVRESLVLLKNEKIGDKTAFELLDESDNVVVLGQKAHDLGSQCGGWTISWQGQSGNNTVGTTIMNGFAGATEGKVTLSQSPNCKISEENDAVIVVVGEGPYAETDGDKTAESLKVSLKDEALLDDLLESEEAKDKPVIGIIIAGRPLNIEKYMDAFDALIMAWLPGTEGEGIADVVFGDYDFSGTLTYTWLKDPANMEQKFAENNDDLVLFEKGFGLNKAGEVITR